MLIKEVTKLTNRVSLQYDAFSSHLMIQGGVFQRPNGEHVFQLPDKILLLSSYEGEKKEYDRATGFYFIQGKEEIAQFLIRSNPASRNVKWIDFDTFELLHELLPQEIAELLYLSHTKTHLHSPFFYKLQNCYVFLPFNQSGQKIYFRYLSAMNQLIACTFQTRLSIHLNDKRRFFQRKIGVELPAMALIDDLKDLMRVGIMVDFDQSYCEEDLCQIPIYRIEHDFPGEAKDCQDENLVALLNYSIQHQEWSILKQEKDFI